MTERVFGLITRGSLGKGLELKLEPGWSVEDMRVGRFVVIDGATHRFFCLVSDMALGATNEAVLLDPPRSNDLARRVVEGITTYGSVSIQPMLMLSSGEAGEDSALGPVRTIPVHFSPVREAGEPDFGTVFGREDGTHFAMGRPLDMEVPVCINLEALVERSNGVFGKSGTGKSFLTRLLLSGVIKNDIASTLVFDMHSEYGWQTQSEEGSSGQGGAKILPGLRRLFGPRVHVYSLDRDSVRARGVMVDGYLDLGLNQIELEDIALLQDELGFSGPMVDTCYLLKSRWGEDWLATLLETEPAALPNAAEAVGAHPSSLAAIYRKLSPLKDLPFIRPKLEGRGSVIAEMMGWLDRGEHVVLEFGRHRKPLIYMLVANIITRHIYATWVEKTETYLQTKRAADRPRRLVLVIEEAHKFLNPRAARNTSFGTIAREMRKYNVTLLVVDQRPSGIDPEVASQLGTRLTALLTEENDIRAVFSGISGADGLRTVLASLDTKKQALIVGHAVPMPVVIRVREYDEAFFAAMSATGVGAVSSGLASSPGDHVAANATAPRRGAAGLLEAFGME